MPTGMMHVSFGELAIGEEFEIHYPGYYCACEKIGPRMYKNLTSGLEKSVDPQWPVVCWVWPHYHEKCSQAAQNV